MGKFDGYLICTDFDGTFATGGQPLPENVEAVRYFTENGGRFTVATGRMVDFIREREVDSIINAPACLCNGSVIYDYQSQTLLRQRNVDFVLGEFLEAIAEAANSIDCLYLFSTVHGSSIAIEDLNLLTGELLDIRPLKLCCKFKTVEAADAFKQYVCTQPFFRDTYISKSWRFGVEFNATDATKGHAVDHIREYLGNIHTAVGVGDFENDLTLLQHADIGATPESGLDCLKRYADWILKPCPEGAIRDLIEKLDDRI